jgi:aminoglycoside 2'-N-acetyltransferase I
MRVAHCRQDDLQPALAAGLRRITELAWPGADARHDPASDPEVFVVEEDGHVVAGCAVLTKSVSHGERRWRVSGLSAVVTDPDHRRRGYGALVAAEARRWILAENRADVGLFSCDRPVAPVYERAGWTVLEGTVLIGGTPSDPFPSDAPGMDKVVLAAWPAGSERSIRDAFLGARVELHPGEVDRLW